MRIFKRILFSILLLLVIIIAAGYFWLKSTAPRYSGKLQINKLKDAVEVRFDEYGVPNIFAGNSTDAYLALGYLHAQERLFQMEMIRRVVSGRLSEILGPSFINTDKKMNSLLIRRMAQNSADEYFKNIDKAYKKEAMAYLDGINYFIENENLPIEFSLFGFKPDKFSAVDIYSTLGYMALSFTSAISQEPLITNIFRRYGDEYLKDFSLDSLSNAGLYSHKTEIENELLSVFNDIQDAIPIPVWEGSNNWVLNKKRSKSGKVLLANDTHIAYSQPSVWYEAHLNYPGFEMSGYYLAGVPYAVMGHNKHYGWGLTIFPFDNLDIYQEKQNPEDSLKYWVNDHWENYSITKFTIKVKDEEDVNYNLKSSRHGPILQEGFANITKLNNQPVSLWWSLHKMKSTVMDALYKINNASDIYEFEAGMPLIDLIGLNVLYGDSDGNIAWWAAGKIPMHPESVNSMLILDGASGNEEILGYYSFIENPQSVNPESGFLHTANNAPPAVNATVYPGYYSGGYRNNRIAYLINSKDKWDIESMSKIQLDNLSVRDSMLAHLIVGIVSKGNFNDDLLLKVNNILLNWDGNSDKDCIAVTIYNRLLYSILEAAMKDELGIVDFDRIVSSTIVRNSIERLFLNNKSPWWDNIKTSNIVETRDVIITQSYKSVIEELKQELGSNTNKWKWGRVHTLTYVHPIGRKKPFDKVFNVGPFAMSGSNEVIDKESFKYNEKGIYKVSSGPAMRMLIDFADADNVWSIIPTGQSGNIMSSHYDDQAKMFVSGKYKTLHLNRNNMTNYKVLKLNP